MPSDYQRIPRATDPYYPAMNAVADITPSESILIPHRHEQASMHSARKGVPQHPQRPKAHGQVISNASKHHDTRRLTGLSHRTDCSDTTRAVSSDCVVSDVDPNVSSLASSSPSTPIASDMLVDATRKISLAPPVEFKTQSNFNFKSSLQALACALEHQQEPVYGFLQDVQQDEITALARAETLVWLSQLIKFHECDHEIFCYAAQLFDRFLSITKLKAKFLRIVSVACFLLASKTLLDECDQPLVNDLVANCDNEFGANDLKRMELVIMDKLHWDLPSKSPVAVLHDLTVVIGTELRLADRQISNLMAELTPKFVAFWFSYELQRYEPSLLAGGLLLNELSVLPGMNDTLIKTLISKRVVVSSAHLTASAALMARHLRVVKSMLP